MIRRGTRLERRADGARVLTKITRYKTQGRRRSLALSYRRKAKSALLAVARAAALCNTPESVDAAAALSEIISGQGIGGRNYLLFLMLLETNNPTVIETLIGDRNPYLLFAPIKPNWFLIKESFRVLAKYKGNELQEGALLALLGVVQNAYKTSKDGHKIFPLSLSDVYTLGKYLDKGRDQSEDRNRLLLDILFDIYFVGIDSDDRSAIQVGIKANEIRMAFFDNTKRMADVIPHVLLIQEAARHPVEPRRFLGAQAAVSAESSGRGPRKGAAATGRTRRPKGGGPRART